MSIIDARPSIPGLACTDPADRTPLPDQPAAAPPGRRRPAPSGIRRTVPSRPSAAGVRARPAPRRLQPRPASPPGPIGSAGPRLEAATIGMQAEGPTGCGSWVPPCAGTGSCAAGDAGRRAASPIRPGAGGMREGKFCNRPGSHPLGVAPLKTSRPATPGNAPHSGAGAGGIRDGETPSEPRAAPAPTEAILRLRGYPAPPRQTFDHGPESRPFGCLEDPSPPEPRPSGRRGARGSIRSRAGGTRCDGLSPGIALAGVPGPGRRPRPRSRRGPDVLELIDPPLEVLDPLDDRAGQRELQLVERAGTGRDRIGAIRGGRHRCGGRVLPERRGGHVAGTGMGLARRRRHRARPARRRGAGFDPPDGEVAGPGALDGDGAGGSARESVGVTVTLAPADRGRGKAPGPATGPESGCPDRLAVCRVTSERQRAGSPSRTTPRTISVRAGMRSSRSIRSLRDRIGWPSRETMRSPGRSPARAAGVPAMTSRIRRLRPGPAPGRTPPSPRASPRASDRPSPASPPPRHLATRRMERPSKPRPGPRRPARGPPPGPRRRASSPGGPPDRRDRRGHGPGAARRSTRRRGSGSRSRSRCPARRRPRPPRRPDARPLAATASMSRGRSPARSGRAGDRQPAADQAQPFAADVNHRGAAVARVERRLDLDQAAELPEAQLQHAVEPRDVPPVDRVPHAERVADHEDLATQLGPVGRRPDRPHRPRRDAQQGQSGVRIGRHPAGDMATAPVVVRHDRRGSLALLARGTRPGRRVSPGRVDPDRQDLAARIDHHSRCDPPPAGRGVARGVLQRHDRFVAAPAPSRSAARIRRGTPASAPHRGRVDARRPWHRRRRARGRDPARPAPDPSPERHRPRRDPTVRRRPHATSSADRARPFAAGSPATPRATRSRPAPRPQRPRRAPSSDDPAATTASVRTAHPTRRTARP